MANDKRRLGRFYLDSSAVQECSANVERVMSEVVILRAEYRFDLDKFEYLALSDKFKEIERGMMAPEYKWVFSQDGSLSAVDPNSALSWVYV